MGESVRDIPRVSFSIKRIPVAVHLGSRSLMKYYDGLRRDRATGLPRRDAIEPWELDALLPFVFFVQPVGANGRRHPDYRFSLIGTGLTRRFNVDTTGLRISEVFDSLAYWETKALYDQVTRRRVLAITDGHFTPFGVEHMAFEAVHLPILARDGRTVQIFGGLFFHDQPLQPAVASVEGALQSG